MKLYCKFLSDHNKNANHFMQSDARFTCVSLGHAWDFYPSFYCIPCSTYRLLDNPTSYVITASLVLLPYLGHKLRGTNQ